MRLALFTLGACVGALVVLLANESTSQDQGESPHEPAHKAPLSEPDFDELTKRERELGEQRARTLTAAADREPIDHDWAPAMERQIAERFALHGPSDSRLLSATCKTSLCILEVETASRVQNIEPKPWHKFFPLSRGFAVSREREGGVQDVIFLAREDHALPE